MLAFWSAATGSPWRAPAHVHTPPVPTACHKLHLFLDGCLLVLVFREKVLNWLIVFNFFLFSGNYQLHARSDGLYGAAMTWSSAGASAVPPSPRRLCVIAASPLLVLLHVSLSRALLRAAHPWPSLCWDLLHARFYDVLSCMQCEVHADVCNRSKNFKTRSPPCGCWKHVVYQVYSLAGH